MRKLALLLATIFAAVVSYAAPRHVRGMSMTNSDPASTRCEDHLIMNTDDSYQTFYGEESRTLPNEPLEVTASQNGGISVTKTTANEYSIKLCKAVVVDNQSDARNLLSQISLAIGSGKVTVNGPEREDGERWSTVIMISAPANSKLDLKVGNGGISLYKTLSEVAAHAINGGISLNGVHGTVNATAVNGGISIADSGGNVTARVQNGGISLVLPHSWQGGTLDASSVNGGISVDLPKDFSSPIEIATSQHTPISCDGLVCGLAQRTWDDERRYFRLGSGTPIVKATTENGGISIHDRGLNSSDDEI